MADPATVTPPNEVQLEISPFEQSVLNKFDFDNEPGITPEMVLSNLKLVEQHPHFASLTSEDEKRELAVEIVKVTLYEEQIVTFHQAVEAAGDDNFKEKILGVGQEEGNRLESADILNAMVGDQVAVEKVKNVFTLEEQERYGSAIKILSSLKENYISTYDARNEIQLLETVETTQLNDFVIWLQNLLDESADFLEKLGLTSGHAKLTKLIQDARGRLAMGSIRGAPLEVRALFTKMPAFTG